MKVSTKKLIYFPPSFTDVARVNVTKLKEIINVINVKHRAETSKVYATINMQKTVKKKDGTTKVVSTSRPAPDYKCVVLLKSLHHHILFHKFLTCILLIAGICFSTGLNFMSTLGQKIRSL